MKKQARKVYHVEFVNPFNINSKQEQHFYFGSQAAIYDIFYAEQLGISYGYLKSKFHLENEPYSNEKCTIRLGVLYCKEKSE